MTARPNPDQAVVEAFFTTKGSTLYVIVPWWPKGEFVLKGLKLNPRSEVTMLGLKDSLTWRQVADNVAIHISSLAADELPCEYAYVLRIDQQ